MYEVLNLMSYTLETHGKHEAVLSIKGKQLKPR